MSDLSSLLAPIRAREVAATEGPWTAEDYLYPDPEGRIRVTSPSDSDYYNLADSVAPSDAAFIAHARTDIPRLLSALDAVLALHKPTPSGDARIIGDVCDECSEVEDYQFTFYPCPTVTAVTAALGEQA